MNRSPLRALVIALVALVFVAGYATPAMAKPQTKCPVMGGPIDKDVFTDYDGQRVYFCCPGCIDTFKANPQKYLKKILDAGIDLEEAGDAPTEGPATHGDGTKDGHSAHGGMGCGGM